MSQGLQSGVGRAEPRRWGEPATARTAGVAGTPGAADRTARPSREPRGPGSCRGGAVDEAEGRGAGDGLGLGADPRPGERFPHSPKLVSYLGLNPGEASRGDRQRLGPTSKQGNSMLRWRLVVEAGQSAARFDPERRRNDQRLKFRRGGKVAKVALARRLAVRLYGMLRQAGSRAPEATTEATMEASNVSIWPNP